MRIRSFCFFPVDRSNGGISLSKTLTIHFSTSYLPNIRNHTLNYALPISHETDILIVVCGDSSTNLLQIMMLVTHDYHIPCFRSVLRVALESEQGTITTSLPRALDILIQLKESKMVLNLRAQLTRLRSWSAKINTTLARRILLIQPQTRLLGVLGGRDVSNKGPHDSGSV